VGLVEDEEGGQGVRVGHPEDVGGMLVSREEDGGKGEGKGLGEGGQNVEGRSQVR